MPSACAWDRRSIFRPTTFRPAPPIIWITPPTSFFATASGFTIPNVLSMAIGTGTPCGGTLQLGLGVSAEIAGHRLAQLGGGGGDGDLGRLQRLDLFRRRALAAADDGAGVAHALAGGRGLAGDERRHRLLHVVAHERGRVLLGRAADLADHQHRLGRWIGLEQLQHVDEVQPLHRIAADPHRGGLPATQRGQLMRGLERQSARTRHHALAAGLVDVARHDPDLARARRDDAGAVRADQRDGLARSALHVAQGPLGPHHVQGGDPLGDADDHVDARGGRFQDGVGGARRRYVDAGGVGARLLHGVGHGVEHGEALVGLSALAGGDADAHLRAVVARLRRVDRAGRARQALHQHLGVLVDQDGHYFFPPAASATIFFAPSAMSSAGVTARPDAASIFLPRSTFVPSRRTPRGTFSPTCLTAPMTPAAMVSHFMMPPKMLTKIPFTDGSAVMLLNAAVTFSSVALPPTSRKLAGSPPKYLMVSMVAIARPAPFTMQPMLPSSLMNDRS